MDAFSGMIQPRASLDHLKTDIDVRTIDAPIDTTQCRSHQNFSSFFLRSWPRSISQDVFLWLFDSDPPTSYHKATSTTYLWHFSITTSGRQFTRFHAKHDWPAHKQGDQGRIIRTGWWKEYLEELEKIWKDASFCPSTDSCSTWNSTWDLCQEIARCSFSKSTLYSSYISRFNEDLCAIPLDERRWMELCTEVGAVLGQKWMNQRVHRCESTVTSQSAAIEHTDGHPNGSSLEGQVASHQKQLFRSEEKPMLLECHVGSCQLLSVPMRQMREVHLTSTDP